VSGLGVIPVDGPRARHEARFDDGVVVIEGPADPDGAVRAAALEARDRLPHWGHLWPMSLALARWVRASLLVAPGARVLEVGCGLGLVGIVGALRGASVTMTDIETDALEWSAHNARLNGAEAAVERFDWNDEPRWSEGFDLMVASDVLYEPASHRPLARLIARLGCPAVLADPLRPASAQAESAFAAAGLRCTTALVPGGRIMLLRAP